MLASILQDLRYALRSLTLNPGFAVVSILALALGIGANSAIFTVVNSVLLRPLQFPNSEQLVVVRDRNLSAGFPQFPLSPANYVDYRDQNHHFSRVAAFHGQGFSLTGGTEAERLRGAEVTPDFFEVLAVQPVLGRSFTQDEAKPGAPPVAILGYELWQRRFGGSRDILTQTVKLDGKITQVVGVMPTDFKFPNRSQVWRPIAYDQHTWDVRGGHWLGALGRLKPGSSLASAQSELNNIADRLQKQYPDSNTGWDTTIGILQDQIVRGIRAAILTLFAAVAFVLLIACANLANLLLSRSAARRREVGIRAALGAGKGRLVRQLLTESLLLSMLGAALGLALARAGTQLLSGLSPTVLPRAGEISLDLRVLAFTAGVAVVTGILFGLAPAFQMARTDLNSALRERGRGSSVGFERNRLRSLLVVGEVALALVLLTGAGLLMRSFYHLQSVDPGFDPHGVLTFRISLPETHYPKEEQRIAFYQRALDQIRALPGVSAAGASQIFPLAEGNMILTFRQPGHAPKPRGQEDSATFLSATPGYFETLKIPLKAGRYFTEHDNATALRVAIISEDMARQFFPNQDPVGQSLVIGGSGNKPCQIVGVVGRVVDRALDDKVNAAMYQPAAQATFGSMYLAVRTPGNPESLISGLRTAIRQFDPELPLDAVGTVEDLVSSSLSQRRLSMVLMAVFAGLALVLATVGIYGVISYSVTQATQEIGIRLALGAQPGDVLRLILRYGLGLMSAGLVIGVAAALATGRLIASQLFEVRPTDPLTYVAVSAALLATGIVACLVPAVRAMRVDPLIALRYE
jgi:putative ABC transport system permease protein